MKSILTVFVLLHTIACMANPEMRTYPKRAPLKGKVKVVRTSGYGALMAFELSSKSFNENDYTVDSYSITGLKMYSCYHHGGKAVNKAFYKYDTKGKLVEEYSLDYERESIPKLYITYLYDTSGNLVEEIGYGKHEPYSQVKYYYKSGRLAIKLRDSLDKVTYSYNDLGQLVKEDCLYFGDASIIITTYTYDSKGRIATEAYTGSKSTTYTYDEHNNEVLAEERNCKDCPVKRSFKTEYVYDKESNWIRCVEDNVDVFTDHPRGKDLTIREISYY